jgi:hypothetical protein
MCFKKQVKLASYIGVAYVITNEERRANVPIIEKYTYAGKFLEIEKYIVLAGGRRTARNMKEQVSTLAQAKLNEKNAKKKLTRLLNTNFNEKDIFVTLTFKNKDSITEKQAKKELDNFLRRLKRFRKKMGLNDLKYISVCELDNKNGIHFHIVMSATSMDAVYKIWGNGRIQISQLLFSDNGLEGLANYMLKQQLEKKNVKKWSQSKNLKKPIVKKKVVKRFNPNKHPKAPKGYKVTNVELSASEFLG